MTPRPSHNHPSGLWDRWSVRLLAVVAILVAILVTANVGDPAPRSWHAKTWELLHDMAATCVGHR